MNAKENMVVAPVITPEWLNKKQRMFAELDKQLNANIISGTGISLDDLQLILERKCPEMVLEKWAQFFKDIFSIESTLSDIIIPPAHKGFGWTAVCLQQIPLNELWRSYADQKIGHFSIYGDDLEAVVSHNDRNNSSNNNNSTILMRNCWEADEELKNFSANQLREQCIVGCTLYERLDIGLFQWWLTGGKNGGRHLDAKTITLCSGSRYDDGRVPGVSWYSDEVNVHWYHPLSAHDSLRARQVKTV
ncbi:MAG: hypothetical protein Q8Q23_01155 [bacterium]|nr:hypothetical protein [bacterium]